MAVWALSAVNAMAAGLNTLCTNSATLIFYDSAGAQVGPPLFGSATFAVASVTGVITCNNFVTATATAALTLGTARLFNAAGATVGVFTCTTGAVDFQFGALAIGASDSIVVNGWSITVQTA